MDIDGNAHYYPVKTIRFNKAGSFITLYPNPAKNILLADGNGEKISGTLVLSDGSGRVVLRKNISATYNVKIDIFGLLAGI